MRSLLLRRSLLTLGLCALLSGPWASAQAPEASVDTFDRFAASIPYAQNGDGGWGRLEPNGDGTRTVRDAVAVRLTAWAAFVMLDMGTDPLWTWTNRDGALLSLANSTTTTSLAWLHRADSQAALPTFGDVALLASVYARLGDQTNARRLADDLMRVQAADGSWGGSVEDTARVLHGLQAARLHVAADQGALRAALEAAERSLASRANGGLASLGDREAAWAALALFARGSPASAEFGLDLANRSRPADVLDAAFVAWALAATDQPEAAAKLLDGVLARPLGGVARLVALEALATLHPDLRGEDRLVFGSAAGKTARGVESFVAVTPASLLADLEAQVAATRAESAAAVRERQALAEREARLLAQEPDRFPLPSGFVAATSLVFLSALTLYGLAIGLHRETLGGQRKAIFDFIDGHPGEHLNAIRRELDISPGTVLYHLHALERGGWITSHRDARYKRFYVHGNRVQQLLEGRDYKEKHAALKNDTARNLVAFVRDHPGVSQKLVSEALALHPSTVNWHVNRLKEANILADERVGREVRYRVQDPGQVDRVLRRLREAPASDEGTPPDSAA